MTHEDYQVMFTALGFLAVIVSETVPREKQAMRAAAIAGLIESFCKVTHPEVFTDHTVSDSNSLADLAEINKATGS